MFEIGTHKVKITGCFVGESTEKGTPFFGIEFTNKNDQSIDWIAYLSDTEFEKKEGKGKIKTTPKKENLKTLLKLGFTGNTIADLADDSKTIEELFAPIQDEIRIVVDEEEYTNEEGEVKRVNKVKWVNIGGGVAKLDHKQAVVKMKGISADLLKLKRDLGIKNEPAAEVPVTDPAQAGQAAQQAEFASEDVPF